MELTGEKCNFHHFRFTGNAQVRTKALVAGMKQAGTLGGKVYAINQNYSWGQDMERAITDNAAAGGYQVVEKTLHDTNKIQDFAPYVSKIVASGAETVITGNWSNDLLLLMKASKAAGLKARFGTVFLDQPGNVSQRGRHRARPLHRPCLQPRGGRRRQHRVSSTTSRPRPGTCRLSSNRRRRSAWRWWPRRSSARKPQGDALNVNAFAKVLEGTRIRTPMGEVSMRAADHQVLMPMVVSMVAKDAKYKADGTDMGFKPVKVFTAEEAAAPVQASCKMQRPD